MQIKDVFANDVTRDIAPVIYFHEQDPAKKSSEFKAAWTKVRSMIWPIAVIFDI